MSYMSYNDARALERLSLETRRLSSRTDEQMRGHKMALDDHRVTMVGSLAYLTAAGLFAALVFSVPPVGVVGAVALGITLVYFGGACGVIGFVCGDSWYHMRMSRRQYKAAKRKLRALRVLTDYVRTGAEKQGAESAAAQALVAECTLDEVREVLGALDHAALEARPPSSPSRVLAVQEAAEEAQQRLSTQRSGSDAHLLAGYEPLASDLRVRIALAKELVSAAAAAKWPTANFDGQHPSGIVDTTVRPEAAGSESGADSGVPAEVVAPPSPTAATTTTITTSFAPPEKKTLKSRLRRLKRGLSFKTTDSKTIADPVERPHAPVA